MEGLRDAAVPTNGTFEMASQVVRVDSNNSREPHAAQAIVAVII